MPRLLIISRSHNPLGGADRIVADLCRELPSRGWETVVGLTRGARFDDPDAYRRVHQDLPTIDIDGTFGTRRARLQALGHAIDSVQPDIVLSMRVFDAYEAVARRKIQSPNVPRLAVGVRAFEAPYLSDARRYRRNIDLCVTSGELIAWACRDFSGLSADRVVSIAGGVSPPMHKVSARQPEEPIRLLYAGRLEQHQKRALDLIPFVHGLAAHDVDFRLSVCGAGPEEQQVSAELEPFINRGIVTMHGWVTQADLYERFYPQSDCFVHFAAWEGVTISPREAMVHGCVPVISEFTGLNAEGQFINGVNSLTFPVGHVGIAVKHVESLATVAGLFQSLSHNALESQIGTYSYAGAIDAWSGALDRCLSQPALRGRLPSVPERLDGRLSRWGMPTALQVRLRHWLNSPIQHDAPGSEWPTSSGLMTSIEKTEIEHFARTCEIGTDCASAT